MSQYVKTRNASQCRSHHQKMLVHHNNISSIIAHLDFMEQENNLRTPTTMGENEVESEKKISVEGSEATKKSIV